MKTEKIKDLYSKAQGFDWLAKCARAYDSDVDSVCYRDGTMLTNGKFVQQAHHYELVRKPKYTPYSVFTLGELEEKASGMMLKWAKGYGGQEARFTLTSMNKSGAFIGVSSNRYTFQAMLCEFEWSDGTPCGTEEK